MFVYLDAIGCLIRKAKTADVITRLDLYDNRENGFDENQGKVITVNRWSIRTILLLLNNNKNLKIFFFNCLSEFNDYDYEFSHSKKNHRVCIIVLMIKDIPLQTGISLIMIVLLQLQQYTVQESNFTLWFMFQVFESAVIPKIYWY